MTIQKLLSISVLFIFLFGCSEESTPLNKSNGEKISVTENPNAKEVLELNPNADIFMWDGGIYRTGVDWIDELELEEDEKVGEIEFQVTKAEQFKNKTANKTPIGAEIYSVKGREDILIVKNNGETKRYYLLSEG